MDLIHYRLHASTIISAVLIVLGVAEFVIKDCIFWVSQVDVLVILNFRCLSLLSEK
jgi:hypothetical protein